MPHSTRRVNYLCRVGTQCTEDRFGRTKGETHPEPRVRLGSRCLGSDIDTLATCNHARLRNVVDGFVVIVVLPRFCLERTSPSHESGGGDTCLHAPV